MSSSELLFRLFFRLLCLLLILSTELHRVDGAPTAATRVPSNINKRASTAKSSSDARLLGGRLSLMAGLGSPAHHHRLPLIPYSNHQGNEVERISSSSSSSSSSSPLYKLPLAHSGWAPYLAAIYEPPPLYSLFQDPLGYLAALLSPSVDWFTGGDSRTAADFFQSTTSPMMVGTSGSGNENDIVVVFDDSDNEIPDDGRKLLKTDGLFEGRMDKSEDAGSSTSAAESTKTTTVTTHSIVSEKNTIAPTESIRRQDAGETSRVTTTTAAANSQSGTRRPTATQPINNNNNKRPGGTIIGSNGGRPTGPLKPIKRPPGRPTTTTTTQESTNLSTFQDQSDGLADVDYDPTDTPAAMTTTTMMTTTAANSTIRPATTNTTTTGYHDGYYYYGHHTQNVSHVVFTTTPRAETMQPSTESLVPLNLGGGGNGGDTDRFFGQQQPGPIYQDYDYQSPIARFDYYNHEEPPLQQPPIEYTYPHHHHQHHHDQPANNHVANEHLRQSQERYLNGFRPSVPYYVFK